MEQVQDEELIAAFKIFGAESIEDEISIDRLKVALEACESNEFDDEELRIIFDEIAGASKKPMMKQKTKQQSLEID